MNADIIRLQNDLDTARERLSAAIEAELSRLHGYGAAEAVAVKAPARAKKRITAEQRASRELQGRYMSFGRSIGAKWKARLAKVREEIGDRAKAINRVKREMKAEAMAREATKKLAAQRAEKGKPKKAVIRNKKPIHHDALPSTLTQAVGDIQ